MTDGMIGGHFNPQEIPHMKGSLIGFRAWNISNNKLVSPQTHKSTWHPGVNTAQCKKSRHPSYKKFGIDTTSLLSELTGWIMVSPTSTVKEQIPHKNCHCGLYAYYTLEERYLEIPDVLGAVLMWGKIELHEKGMRAEYAMPIILAMPERDNLGSFVDQFLNRAVSLSDRVKNVAERYEMEVVNVNELVSRASTLGKLYPFE